MPSVDFLYGTAWKEERTQRCVELALEAGFRGIDTANQLKNYFEAGVGAALRVANIPRAELFLQTKFTFAHKQDERLPFDAHAPIARQVEQSYASSLEHLGVDGLDVYMLHVPSTRDGWQPADREAWAAMESLRVPQLGVSNVTLDQLKVLCQSAHVQPSVVQNRCFARTGWDAGVRAFCRESGIRYQPYSLLTGNPEVLALPDITAMAHRHGKTPAQVIFGFVLTAGMQPLTGTSDPEHMRMDLDATRFKLDAGDVATVERCGAPTT